MWNEMCVCLCVCMCVRVCVYNVETKLEQKERTGQNIFSKKILRFLTLMR